MKKSDYEAARIDGILLAVSVAVGIAQCASLKIGDHVSLVTEPNLVASGRNMLVPGYTVVIRVHDALGNRFTVDEFEARRSGFIHRFIALVAAVSPDHPVAAFVSSGHVNLNQETHHEHS